MIGQSLFPMSLDLLRPPGGAAVPPARGGACVSIRSLQEGFRRHLDMTRRNTCARSAWPVPTRTSALPTPARPR
jgi:hypothetical protein